MCATKWLIFLSLIATIESVSIMIGGGRRLIPNTLKSDAEAQRIALRNKNAFDCEICTLIIDGLQALLKQNKTDQDLDEFIASICKAFNLEQNYICDRISSAFAYEFYFVLERVIFTPNEICGAFISNCGTSSFPLFVNWSIPIPGGKPPIREWPMPSSNLSPKLRVLHLSDIHVDWSYTENSEAACEYEQVINDFALCCRNSENRQARVRVPAGPWGMPNRCDIPYRTFESAMRHISRTEQLDYIIVTGDLVAHDSWDYTKERTQATIENITATLLQYFPRTPIYEAVGNHEGVPQDAMAPHGMEEYSQRGPEWLYRILGNAWGNWLPQAAVDQVNYRASFAIRAYPGLKLVSVNSVYCAVYNYYVYLNQTDPDGTLQWLIQELIDSETRGEKVHIISHIPAGDTYCLQGWAANYYEIINRFEGIIAAQFYGHTHQDQFEVYYENSDPRSRPTHFNFIAPSLTTSTFNMPAYRIYTIDGNYPGSTWTVLDAETYTTNLTLANANNEEPTWQLEYNMRETYNMSDLSPASWHQLIERLDKDEQLFQRFLRFYYRSDYGSDCDSQCRMSYVCAMRMAKSYAMTQFCKDLLR